MKLVPSGGMGALFPLLVMLLLAMLTLWLVRTIAPSNAPAPAINHDPDYVVDKLSLLRLSVEGTPRYLLTADKMVHFPNDDSSHLERPTLRQLQPDKPELRFSAARGIVTAGGDVVHLRDDVEILRAGKARGGGTRGEDLRITTLVERARAPQVCEVIIALSATIDGQTTAHYLTERLRDANVSVTRLAHGVPVGGELELLDDGTLLAALSSRRPF